LSIGFPLTRDAFEDWIERRSSDQTAHFLTQKVTIMLQPCYEGVTFTLRVLDSNVGAA